MVKIYKILYVSSHINIDYKIKSKGDIAKSTNEFNDIITNAAALVTPNKTNKPPGLRRITNVEIEKLVSEKRRARREWQVNRSANTQLYLKDSVRKLRKALKCAEEYSTENYLKKLSPNSTIQTPFGKLKNTLSHR